MHRKYFSFLMGNYDLRSLKVEFSTEWREAQTSVLCAELGNPEHENKIFNSIKAAIGDEPDFYFLWVFSCQAYSIAGRSRMLGKRQHKNDDDRLSQIKNFITIENIIYIKSISRF